MALPRRLPSLLRKRLLVSNSMQTNNSRLQLTYYLLQVIKLSLLFAFTIMTVGTGVGRWRFTFRALRGLMAEPATEVTFPAKSCSSAKLHRGIIIMRVDYVNREGNKTFMLALFVNDASLCEHRTNLLSHLHS